MSVRPGLMAVSRVGVSSSALRTQWVRHASNSTSSSTATVQDADKQIKERQRMMRRLPPGFDTSAAYAPVVFEPVVDPKFSIAQLVSFKYGTKYLWQRFKRAVQTAQMGSRYILDEDLSDKNRSFLQKCAAFVTPPSRQLMHAVAPKFESLYKAYNEAQAKGDVNTLKTLSMGPALERGTAVAKALANQKGSWRLVRHVTPPRVAAVRTGPMDMTGEKTATQFTIQYDTEQVFQAPKREAKTRRVREYIVFDRETRPGAPYRIKDFVKETDPSDPAASERR